MEKILLNVIQMSIYGSIAIALVMIMRKCFTKLPKRVICLFWIVPIVRLLCPLNFNMNFGLLNINRMNQSTSTPSHARTAINALFTDPMPLSPQHQATVVNNAADNVTTFDLKTVVFGIWLLGVVSILIYLTIKTVRLYSILKNARKPVGRNYYVSDAIDTSFVLGIISPVIYMQSGLSEKEEKYIYMHELTHIKNRDHITRFVGVLTVCLHWFNPIVWIGFMSMCSDLEMRCDEEVIDTMGTHIKKDYCISIVEHATQREYLHSGLYSAFAGNRSNGREIKMRVNNLINYKRMPKILAAAVVVIVIGVVAVFSSKVAEGKDVKEGASAVQMQKAQAEAVNVSSEISNEELSEEEDSEEEHVGRPVGDPNVTELNLTTEECLLNYGFNGMVIPDDVEYSDEGRPYSKSYDFRTDPTLNTLAEIFEDNGYEVINFDVEYLDKEGNIKTGKELYHFSACKGEYDVVNVSLCSKEYGEECFNDHMEEDGIWYVEEEDSGWKTACIYDSKAGVVMYADGYEYFDWRSMGLFEAIR